MAINDPVDMTGWSQEDIDFYVTYVQPEQEVREASEEERGKVRGDGYGTRKRKIAKCAKCEKDKTMIGRGLCMTCYQQERRNGTLGNWTPGNARLPQAFADEMRQILLYRQDELRFVLRENGQVLITALEYQEFLEYRDAKMGNINRGRSIL